MNGILVINKPQGFTSFDVVRIIKRTFKEKRVGHLGTLDPMATGVLPIFLGKYTKLIPHFNECDKVYKATLKLGESTDTFDAEGEVQQSHPWESITSADVLKALSHFQGVQQQAAPIYSALKQNGVPAYKLARQGKPVERKVREIEIHSIALNQIEFPYVTFTVHCSKGTYIRTLADDIGAFLGVGAHLTALERQACGASFLLKQATTLDEIEDFPKKEASYWINPVEVLQDWLSIVMNVGQTRALQNGQTIPLDGSQAFEKLPSSQFPASAMALDTENHLLAIGSVTRSQAQMYFKPNRIFV